MPDKSAELLPDVQLQEHQRTVSALLKHANLAFADKLPKPAAQFINTAELMGSRGRARMYGRPEPEGRDHDYIVFTDDKKQHEQLRQMLQALAREHGYKLHQRPSGFLTASGNNMDLSFYPTAKREQIHKAWALQEGGMSKDDAWAQIESQKTAELLPDVQLQEHQQRVSDRLSGENPRLLFYHGLGTGKSLSSIAAAEAAKRVHGGEYGVVVPASLRSNFNKEIQKFTRDSKPEVLSYSNLALGKNFAQQPDTLVMDEAQRIKNPDSSAALAARRIAANAKRLVLLSGTPITNSPGDLASPLGMLRNEAISPQGFEKQFVGYKKKFPGLLPYLRGAQFGEEPYVKNEDQLRQMLAGHVDYQPGKLPEGVNVNEETVRVPLSAEQRRIQKAVRTKIPPGFLWKLDQEFPLSREELGKLNSFMTGMRQVSLSTQPFRADKNPLKAFDQSSKLREALKRLRETLDSDPRRKAIVYSNFVDAGIGPYAAALEREKIPYGVFHGGMPVKARQQALNDYNSGKLRALLLGPAAAEGISTKGTSLIQLLDPYWHESRTQQARGRGLRFDSHQGLPDELKNVAVQRYLSSSDEPGLVGRLVGKRRERTGDEVMQHLAEQKEQLNEKFRQILREVGTPKPKESEQGDDEHNEKQALNFAPFVKAVGGVVGKGLRPAAKTVSRIALTPGLPQLAKLAPAKYRPGALLAAKGLNMGLGAAALHGGYVAAQNTVGSSARLAASQMTNDPAALQQVEERARSNALPLAWKMFAPSFLGGDNTPAGQVLRKHMGTVLQHTALPYLLSADPSQQTLSSVLRRSILGRPAQAVVTAMLPQRPAPADLLARIPEKERAAMGADALRAAVSRETTSPVSRTMQHVFEPAAQKSPFAFLFNKQSATIAGASAPAASPTFRNQHYTPPRPPISSGTVAGSYKTQPAPKPVDTGITRLGPPAQGPTGEYGAHAPVDTATAGAWQNWVNRNYVGAPRFDLYDKIQTNLDASPGAAQKYQGITDTMGTRAMQQARQPFETSQNSDPLLRSHILRGNSAIKPILSVGDSEQYVGQKQTAPFRVLNQLGGAMGVKPTTMGGLTGGNTMRYPAMTRGLIQTHEMEHINQGDMFKGPHDFADETWSAVPRQALLEPAAVLNEQVHAIDAAHQATGQPVQGTHALTPNYQPKLEWMRQQAMQHGLQNMGPAGTGNKTMQELLNTPEGQAWLRMQLRDLQPPEPTPPPAAPPSLYQRMRGSLMGKSGAAEPQEGEDAGLKAAASGWKQLAAGLARFGAGAGAGYYANDQYLDRVNPEVTDLGRTRSNVLSAVLGGALASKGVAKRMYRAQPISVGLKGSLPTIGLKPTTGGLGLTAGAAALAARYGVIMPDQHHGPLGFGFGKTLDPGHSFLPKMVAGIKDPETQDKVLDFALNPTERATQFAGNKVVDKLMASLQDPNERSKLTKQLKDDVLPVAYGATIASLGGQPGAKPTIGDVGVALAPHLAGGAGGGYLGTVAGGHLGNFLFKDDPKADYEERRRQEQRRWWLQFLGGNLGMVGGTMATMHAMPKLNELIAQYAHKAPATKSAGVGSAILRALAKAKKPALNLGADAAIAGGLTAGQYGLGMVPPGSYDAEGKPGPANDDFWGMKVPLFAANFAATRGAHARDLLSGAKGYSGPARFRTNPITHGLVLGAAASASPSVVNSVSSFPSIYNGIKKYYDKTKLETVNGIGPAENENEKGLNAVLKGDFSRIFADARRGLKSVTDQRGDDVKKQFSDVVLGAASDAGVPGVGEGGKKTLRELALSAGMSTALQGGGLATGGVAGLVGGDWLADKILTTAVKRKWLKKRPALHQFIRDLASVTGAGLGAYGGVRALNYALPKAVNYYHKVTAKPEAQSEAPPEPQSDAQPEAPPTSA